MPDPVRLDEIVVFGKVAASYGLRGAIKVHPFADDLEGWAELPEWRLGEAGGAWRPCRLLSCHVRDRLLIARLEGVDDRDAADRLRGLLVGVPREALPPLGEDEFYWDELIGLEVVNLEGRSLGWVRGLIETPANDVLQVVDETDGERLLPFVGAVVLEVDRFRRVIRVDWNAAW